jgi:hypothetical protein
MDLSDKILITYSKCLYLKYKNLFDKDNLKCIQKFKINCPSITDQEKRILDNILQVLYNQYPSTIKTTSTQFSNLSYQTKEHIDDNFNKLSQHIKDTDRHELINIIENTLITLLKNNISNYELISYIELDNYSQEDFLNAYDIVCYAALYNKTS